MLPDTAEIIDDEIAILEGEVNRLRKIIVDHQHNVLALGVRLLAFQRVGIRDESVQNTYSNSRADAIQAIAVARLNMRNLTQRIEALRSLNGNLDHPSIQEDVEQLRTMVEGLG